MYLASGYQERTSTGPRRSATIGGQPGFEERDSESGTGEVTVLVGKRFIVNARGINLDGIEPVRAVVERIDLNALAALK